MSGLSSIQQQEERRALSRSALSVPGVCGAGSSAHQQHTAATALPAMPRAATPPSDSELSSASLLHDALCPSSSGQPSTSAPSISGGAASHAARATPLPSKSAKRCAAEALLAARYSLGSSGTDSASAHAQLPPFGSRGTPGAAPAGAGKRRVCGDGGCAPSSGAAASGLHTSAASNGREHSYVDATDASSSAGSVAAAEADASGGPVLVRGCPPDCPCRTAAAAAPPPSSSSSSAHGGAARAAWCAGDARIPHTPWASVYDSNPSSYAVHTLARGHVHVRLPDGLTVSVVSSAAAAPAAIEHLASTMGDAFVAIDLEWRPVFRPGQAQSKVAVIQLATSTHALVIHTAVMGFSLPPAVRAFLTGGTATLVGFSWDSSDEAKMRCSFGIGRDDFPAFVDLQEVATSLGYHDYGLSRLTQRVTGLVMPKSKKVQCSNWAAHSLSMQQIKYAALDVFSAGTVFRGLRLWHSSPSPCPSCLHPVGADRGELFPLRCGAAACDATFSRHSAWANHTGSTGHAPDAYAVCGTCGRLQPKK
ncbi:hypothetical protein FOA52_001507 [Chlamydomonas sp. UWO 241]|nr:hypothetical protein FOA52_001507 [Chlamydomonas sp. UWO 241]